MDAIYRRQRHVYGLTRKYYLLGRDEMLSGLDLPDGGHVLEIGCGTGRNLIVAARLWSQVDLYGLDISDEMLKTAGGAIRRAGLQRRILVGSGDAAGFDAAALFGRTRFDRVLMSYTLSMIPDWWGALRSAAALIAPGGQLEIVDFGQLEDLPAAFRALLFSWLRPFDVIPRAELRTAAELAGVEEGLNLRFRSLKGGYAWRITLARPF